MTAKEFWTWFLDKQKDFEKFIKSPSGDYTLYNELIDKLKTFHELVVAELTMDEEDRHILILTCDGKSDGIPFVEELYACAPPIDGWKVQKFRAPGHVKDVNYQGLKLRPTDIMVKYDYDGEWYDLEVFIKGYKDSDDRYKALAFLYLDHLVGEYNVMTKIGAISFGKLALFGGKSDKVSLQDLRVAIERLN
jgi:hypothetical protein